MLVTTRAALPLIGSTSAAVHDGPGAGCVVGSAAGEAFRVTGAAGAAGAGEDAREDAGAGAGAASAGAVAGGADAGVADGVANGVAAVGCAGTAAAVVTGDPPLTALSAGV
jgi:hypothetical protein